MKHTLRCMKNEVGFAYEACLRHTEKLVCASLHGRCRRLLHGNEVDASYSPRRMLHSFRRPYNQTKRVDKLACQRASADCSANVLQ